MNSNKLRLAVCSITLTLIFPSVARAECCKGLDTFIGIMAVIAGLPLLVGAFFLITNLSRLEKALKLIVIVWVATFAIFTLIYIGFALTDNYGPDSLSTLGGFLFGGLMPLSVLFIFAVLLYFIKAGVQKFIKAKRDYEGK